MKLMTELVVEEASKVGLKFNIRKTEVMKTRNSDNRLITIHNTDLKEVEKFRYLSFEIRNDSNVRDEVGMRIWKVEAAFRLLNKVWKEHNVSLSMKHMLFKGIWVSVLVYGCKSWKGLKEKNYFINGTV